MQNNVPMLFPVEPEEFYRRMRMMIEEVVEKKLHQPIESSKQLKHLPEKPLLKASEVCAIFQVTKPTLYDWLKHDKIASFKIQSRRYFSREEIESMIRRKGGRP